MSKNKNIEVNTETGEVINEELAVYSGETEIAEIPAQYALPEQDDFVGQLLSQQLAYTSYNLQTLDLKTKAVYFNAVNNTQERIRAKSGQIIWVRDMYVTIAVVKQDDGQLVKAPRTVLIDKDGIGYGAVSIGVWQSIKNLIASYGEPSTWEEPLPLKVNLIPKDKFLITSLSIDIESLK